MNTFRHPVECLVILFVLSCGIEGLSQPPNTEHQRYQAVKPDWERFEVAARTADSKELLGILDDILKKDPSNKDALSRKKALESGEGSADDLPMLALLLRIHLKNNKSGDAVREAKKVYALQPDDWIANCVLGQDAIARKDAAAINKHLAVLRDPKAKSPLDVGGLIFALELFRQAGLDATPLRSFAIDRVIPNLKNANLAKIHPAGRIQILACYLDTCLSVEDASVSSLFEYWPYARRLADGILSDAKEQNAVQVLSQLGSLQQPLAGVVARFQRLKLVGEAESVRQNKDLETSARSIWAALRSEDPKNPQGYVGEAYALLRNGDSDGAMKMILAGQKANGQWNFPLLTTYVAWAKATNKAADILPSLVEVANRFPESTELWQLVAEAAEASRRRDLAIDAIQKARQRFPESSSLLGAEARLWADADRYDKGLTLLKSIPEADRVRTPTYARIYVRTLLGTGENDRAKEVSRLILTTAEKTSDQALALALLQGLLDAPATASSLDLAVELAGRATTRWPGDKEIIRSSAKIRFRASEAGDPPWQKDRNQVAVTALERARDLDPLDPWFSAMLAWLRIKGGLEPDRAWDDSATARAAFAGPALPADVLEALGVVYLSRKEYDATVAVLTRASETAAQPAGPFVQLAIALHGKGDRDAARKAFEKAKQLPKSVRVEAEFKVAAELFKD